MPWLWVVIALLHTARDYGLRHALAIRSGDQHCRRCLWPPDGQAFARVENTRGFDVVDDFAFLAQLMHRPGDADPGHQLLLASVLDLAHSDVLPLDISAFTNLLCPEPVGGGVGPQAVVLLHQKAVGPPTGGIHHDAPGAVPEDASRDLPHLKAPPGGGRTGVWLLTCTIDRPPVTDDFATVGVDLHWDDGKVKALAVIVQVHLDVDEGVAQALPVQGLVGIRHIHT